MKIKELKQFIEGCPDDFEIGLSGDFEPDAMLYLVIINDKLRPIKSFSLTSPTGEYLAESQLQELDSNPETNGNT